MRLTWLGIALLLIPLETMAQNTAGWLPVHIGDRWIYQHTTRDEDGRGRAHLSIHAWSTEETTVGSWTAAQGMIVTRQVHVMEGSPPDGWRVDRSQAYLIRGDCLFADEVGWNPLAHQLTADFSNALTASEISPDFCFPLTSHKTWGAPHGLPDWNVTRPEDAKDWEVSGINRQTFHITSISAYPGSGETVDIWFRKSVGVVREQEIHHGTIGEEDTRLVRFEPAAQR